MGLPTILFLIFLVLKLTDHIDWSWWWVTSPLWIELLVGMFIVFVAGSIGRRAIKDERKAILERSRGPSRF